MEHFGFFFDGADFSEPFNNHISSIMVLESAIGSF